MLAMDKSPADLFDQAIKEKPSVSVYRQSAWHIGNITPISQTTGTFAVGKTTKATKQVYDEETGDFIEELDEPAPFTLVYYARSVGLLGITKNTRVANTPEALARRIQRLLASTDILTEIDAEVYVDPMKDPVDFVAHLRSAHSIKYFRATFTGPNPVDADKLFQKPLSVYCREMNASEGSATVKGDHLNEDTAEAVARSTAATGNDASARLQYREGARSETVSLQGNTVSTTVDEQTASEEVVDAIMSKYNSIARHEDN